MRSTFFRLFPHPFTASRGYRKPLASTMLALALTACGGGGGGTTPPAANPTPPTPPDTTVKPEMRCAP